MKPPIDSSTTRALLARLWRDHLRHYKPGLALVLLLSAAMAGATALYPLVLRYAGILFADTDPRIAWQIPLLVVLVTLVKATTQYFQSVEAQAPGAESDPRPAEPHVRASDAHRPRPHRARGAGATRHPLHHRCGRHPRGADPLRSTASPMW